MTHQHTPHPEHHTPASEYARRTILGLAAVGITAYVATHYSSSITTRNGLKSKNDGGAPVYPPQTAEPSFTPDFAPNEASVNDLLNSNEPVMQGLGEVEQTTGVHFDGAMQPFYFDTDGPALADDMKWEVPALQEAMRLGVPATVVLSPNDNADFSTLDQPGAKNYFQRLFDNGIRDRAVNGVNPLSRVVVCPSYISGNWAGNDPSRYIDSVNAMTGALHEVFPNAGASVLVDGADQAEVDTLLGVVKQANGRLNRAALDSVGVQGFPNAPIEFAADGTADISSYLDAGRILQIAEAYGRDRVWLHTAFVKRGTGSSVEYTLDQRQAIAQATAGVVTTLQQHGITVETVNVSLEDASQTNGSDYSVTADEAALIQSFAQTMQQHNVPLSARVAG